MPDKTKRIRVVPVKEARKSWIVFGTIAVLFFAATYMTRYNPLEFLFNMKNFWLFIFEDLVPPKVSDWQTILRSLGQTFAMAVAATFVSSIVSLVLAFLGSYTTAPWKPMKKIIRVRTGASSTSRLRCHGRSSGCATRSLATFRSFSASFPGYRQWTY